MTSWSYQSTNPCTVLVKEKQDGQSPTSRDCPPPILQSSTETVASSLDQSDISLLGNIVGGKQRSKRQTHDDGVVGVVFENGDDQHEFEAPVELVEERILVNISIAMDNGLGSTNHKIYQLQVAVPLLEKKKSEKFYSYDVGVKDEGFIAVEPLEKLMLFNESMITINDVTTTYEDSFTSDTFDETSTVKLDDFITSSTSFPWLEGLRELT